MTEPETEPYVPADRTGYQISTRNADNQDAQTIHIVAREIDGTGLGAYSSDEQVDIVIAQDRQMIADLPQGVNHIPPLVNLPAGPESAMQVNESGAVTPAEPA